MDYGHYVNKSLTVMKWIISLNYAGDSFMATLASCFGMGVYGVSESTVGDSDHIELTHAGRCGLELSYQGLRDTLTCVRATVAVAQTLNGPDAPEQGAIRAVPMTISPVASSASEREETGWIL